MNKLTIPALLLGVVMIAGAFAFMPVQEASTVHTSAANTANSIKYLTITDTCTVGSTANTECDNITVNVDTGDVYELVSMSITVTLTNGSETVNYNDCLANGVATGIDLANIAATGTIADGTAVGSITTIGISGDDIVCGDSSAASSALEVGDTIVTTMVLKINADADDPSIDNA